LLLAQQSPEGKRHRVAAKKHIFPTIEIGDDGGERFDNVLILSHERHAALRAKHQPWWPRVSAPSITLPALRHAVLRGKRSWSVAGRSD